MAIIDERSVIQPGIQSGSAHFMRLGDTISGKTIVQFIEYVKLTGDHVDEAKIVGDLLMDHKDLTTLARLLNARLEAMES